MATIGENIRKQRRLNKLTQKRLGEKCGINEVQIRSYELGKSTPKIGTLKKIASALNVSVSELDESLKDSNVNTQEPVKSSEICFRENFGIMLKEYRENKKMTIKDLSEKCGVDEKKIECFEVGKTVPNSDQEMIDIIEALQMDIVQFFRPFFKQNDFETEFIIDGIFRKIGKSSNFNVNEFKKSYEKAKKAFDFSEREIYLLQIYKLLNEKGREEAIERIEELTYIPKYTNVE